MTLGFRGALVGASFLLFGPCARADDAPAVPAVPTAPTTVQQPGAAPAPTPTPASSAPASPPAALAQVGFDRPGKRYTTWDANIDGAFGRLFTDPAQWSGFGRVRAGVLWVRDPTFLSLGVTYEASNVSAATLGLQGEWMNIETGTWAQIGPLIDVANGARPGVMGAIGWSVIGIEVQGRDTPDSGFVPAVYAKLRIPIGILAFGLRGR